MESLLDDQAFEAWINELAHMEADDTLFGYLIYMTQ